MEFAQACILSVFFWLQQTLRGLGDGADLCEVSEARRQEYPPKGKPGKLAVQAQYPISQDKIRYGRPE